MKKHNKQLETAAAAPEAPAEIERREWLAIRKQAGREINSETAEVTWVYGQIGDPYGIYPELSEEGGCVGRNYFARSAGSDTWVSFDDLPRPTADALWKKHRAKLAFPAGLPQIEDDETVMYRDGDGKLVVQLGELTVEDAKVAEQSAKRRDQIAYRDIRQPG
jgi:hypothetical protein